MSNYMLTASPYIKDSIPPTSSSMGLSLKNPETSVPLSGYNAYYPYPCSYPYNYLPMMPQLPNPNLMSSLPQVNNPHSLLNHSAMHAGSHPSVDGSSIPIGTVLSANLKRLTEGQIHPSQFPTKEEYFNSSLREQQLQRYRTKKLRRVYSRPVDEKRSQQAKNRERNSRGRFVVHNNK